MARSPRSLGGKEEKVETISSGPIPDVELPPVTNENQVVADARAKNPKPKAEQVGPKPRYFRVTRGGMILHNGYRTRMPAGKEIDDLNYDIRKLQQQGVQLQEISPEDRTGAPMSSFDDE